MLEVGVVAGESSGDLLAGLLLDGMQMRWLALKTYGIGGLQMKAHGFDAWWSADKLSVHGYGWEVLRRYREIVAIRRQLRQRLLQQRPDLFIGVDAPDFNLELEAALKARAIKTVHFVCPSIWAWRAGRVEQLRRSADRVLCVFPFEPELLEQHGIAATYVGHPLANVIPLQIDRAVARAQLGLNATDLVLALLPGSRLSEIKHLAQLFFQAAKLVQLEHPQLKIVLPALPTLRGALQASLAASALAGSVQLVAGQSHTVLAACDLTLIASGTATLEAALFKRPMVIAYRMGTLSWQIMRRQQLQPWVGLPNILCQDFVVPELIQQAASAPALAQALLDWIDALERNPAKIAALEQKFTALHLQLKRDTPRLATDAIEQILQS